MQDVIISLEHKITSLVPLLDVTIPLHLIVTSLVLKQDLLILVEDIITSLVDMLDVAMELGLTTTS